MKNLFIIIFLTLVIKVGAQTVLEQTYASAGYYGSTNSQQQLYVVKLEVDGNKFAFVDKANKLLKFYDVNHALWKTISFFNATDLNPTYDGQSIFYISQHLFDTDDEIEFVYVDQFGPTSSVTQIVNEDGTILFTATNQGPFVVASAPQEQLPIYNTNTGAKMILSGINGDGNAYVYGLAGTLTTEIATHQTDVQLKNGQSIVLEQNLPNPFAEQTTISYYLPETVSRAQIVFLDQTGKIIKAVELTEKGKGQLNVFANDLSNGIYTYSIIVDGQPLETKKMIKAK